MSDCFSPRFRNRDANNWTLTFDYLGSHAPGNHFWKINRRVGCTSLLNHRAFLNHEAFHGKAKQSIDFPLVQLLTDFSTWLASENVSKNWKKLCCRFSGLFLTYPPTGCHKIGLSRRKSPDDLAEPSAIDVKCKIFHFEFSFHWIAVKRIDFDGKHAAVQGMWCSRRQTPFIPYEASQASIWSLSKTIISSFIPHIREFVFFYF